MILVKLCWLITLLAAGAAGFLVVFGTKAANGAPQEAAVAALAAAICIVPYVFTRAFEALSATPTRIVRTPSES